MITLLKRTVPLAAVIFCVASPSAMGVPLPLSGGGFGIAPARRHVVGQPGIALTPTTVFNGTSSSYQVSVFPAILTQDLSGAFNFSATPRNLNDSKLVLTAGPDRFAMAPGTTKQVSLRWNLLPTGRKWLAVGVVFQGVANGQGGSVRVISRLLSVNFLSLPGLNTLSGDFTGLYGRQVAPHVLQFVARVQNTGNTFSGPSAGQLVIRDGLGNVVVSTPWTGDVILPGAQRDFPILVHKVLPAGQYTATVQMQYGGEHSRSTAFTLVGPNELPTPAIAIRAFSATGVVGGPAHVAARIISDGTAPAALTLHLFLADVRHSTPGANALAATQISYQHLAPGSTTELSRGLGNHLAKGVYRALLTWTDPAGAQHTLETEFSATANQSVPAMLWAFIKGHLLLWLGLLLLGLLLAVAWLLRRMRDRERRIEADLVAARRELELARLEREAQAHEPVAKRARRAAPATKANAKANGAAPRARRPVAKTNGSNGNGAKAPATKTNGAAPRVRRPVAKTNGSNGNGAKAPATKTNGAAPRARRPVAKTNGSNGNGANAPATKTDRAAPRAKRPAARTNGSNGNGVNATATKAETALQPKAPDGANDTGEKKVKLDRADELLTLARTRGTVRRVPANEERP